MFGGLFKSTSLVALVAVMAASASAQAADLGVGGNCCADLEERIAELEATTVRKGNRKVSLTVSGFVNEQILAFDDGVETNAYVGTNDTARTRFRFLGSAKIDSSWSAGYLLEIGVRGGPSYQQSADVASGAGKGLDVRHSAWWLSNKDLGKVWVGQTSTSSDGITEINLASATHFAGAQIGDYIGGFSLRGTNGAKSTVSIQQLMNQGNTGNTAGAGSSSQGSPGEGTRQNIVKYETPTLAGFVGSAAWGEDKFWDVALRYAGEFSGFKLAGGIAYTQIDDGTSNFRICSRVVGGGNTTCDELGLSGSIMHVPTGLYGFGAYGYHNDDNRQLVANLAGTKKKDEFYYLQGGIEQSFFPVGKSTFFGEYENGDYGASVSQATATSTSQNTAARTLGAALGGGTAAGSFVNSTNIDMWGIGFNQNVAAAAMDLYVNYRNYSFDVKTTTGLKAQVEDLQTVIMGARIQF